MEKQSRDTVTCANCSKQVKEERSQYAEHQYFCQDCFDELFSSCNHCGDIGYSDDMHSTPDGDVYCESCYNAHYVECYDCERVVAIDDARHSGDRAICERCYDRNYFYCESCDGVYHNDDYGSDGYCQSCTEERGDDGAIHDYDYKPSPIFHGQDKSGLFMGIELEVENKGRCDTGEKAQDFIESLDLEDGKDFYLKHDGSLDNGWENVSHPRTLQSWHEFDYASMLTWLAEHQMKASESCGLHVHISKGPISEVTQSKIGFFWYSQDSLINQICRRVGNHYAKKIDSDKPRKLTSEQKHGYGDRYEAINYTVAHTLEFRQYASTLNPVQFIAAIEMTHAVTTFCELTSVMTIAKVYAAYEAFKVYLFDHSNLYPNLCKVLSIDFKTVKNHKVKGVIK